MCILSDTDILSDACILSDTDILNDTDILSDAYVLSDTDIDQGTFKVHSNPFVKIDCIPPTIG